VKAAWKFIGGVERGLGIKTTSEDPQKKKIAVLTAQLEALQKDNSRLRFEVEVLTGVEESNRKQKAFEEKEKERKVSLILIFFFFLFFFLNFRG
jgi:hypothetical protein